MTEEIRDGHPVAAHFPIRKTDVQINDGRLVVQTKLHSNGAPNKEKMIIVLCRHTVGTRRALGPGVVSCRRQVAVRPLSDTSTSFLSSGYSFSSRSLRGPPCEDQL
uniref:Uncharacterized protein n=1 Tax=Romanomermis culicivorax TaxID=13658 RepID=A0A915I4L4_ROMCU